MTDGFTDRTKELFWAKVGRVDDADSCWLWTASTTSHGYGTFRINNKTYMAHRMSCQMATQVILSTEHHVMHSCDVPRCVRPSHLSIGTRAANMADMAAKRRSTIGVRNPGAKLRENEMLAIRSMHEDRTPMNRIAMVFGVSPSLISRICAGHRWGRVAA
jgi:hypothetical protein